MVSNVIEVPAYSLTESSGLGNVGNWDSLSHTKVLLALENEFDISFDFDELDRLITISEIIQSIKAKRD